MREKQPRVPKQPKESSITTPGNHILIPGREEVVQEPPKILIPGYWEPTRPMESLLAKPQVESEANVNENRISADSTTNLVSEMLQAESALPPQKEIKQEEPLKSEATEGSGIKSIKEDTMLTKRQRRKKHEVKPASIIRINQQETGQPSAGQPRAEAGGSESEGLESHYQSKDMRIDPSILAELRKLLENQSPGTTQTVRQASTPQPPASPVTHSNSAEELRRWIESGEDRRFLPGEEEDAKEIKRLELERKFIEDGGIILPQRGNR